MNQLQTTLQCYSSVYNYISVRPAMYIFGKQNVASHESRGHQPRVLVTIPGNGYTPAFSRSLCTVYMPRIARAILVGLLADLAASLFSAPSFQLTFILV